MLVDGKDGKEADDDGEGDEAEPEVAAVLYEFGDGFVEKRELQEEEEVCEADGEEPTGGRDDRVHAETEGSAEVGGGEPVVSSLA